MTQLSMQLVANRDHLIAMSGRFFMLTDTGAATGLYVRLDTPGRNDEELTDARKGTRIKLGADAKFKSITLRSTVNALVTFIVSEHDVDYSFLEGANVNATITNPLPVPVSNDRGSPGNLLYVSGVSISDAPATSVTAAAPVAVTSAGQVLATADANRRELRFVNLGPDPVAIGPAGATWAQRVIVLAVDDVFVETRAANLAWSGITSTGTTASVGVQGVLA